MSFATRQVKPRRVLLTLGRLKIEFSWSGLWYFGHYWQLDSSDGYHGLGQGFGLFTLRFLRRWSDWTPPQAPRRSVYSRPECVFCYCPEPFACRSADNCRYKVSG